jgi:hypothetical protein
VAQPYDQGRNRSAAGRASRLTRRLPRLAIAAAAVAIAAVLSIQRLHSFPYAYQLGAANWRAAAIGILPLLPQTGWTAIKVWTFWGFGAVLIASA